MRSATIGLDPSLHSLTYLTNHKCIFAAIDTERNAAADPRTQEKCKTPNPSHSSGLFRLDVAGLSPAEWTHVPVDDVALPSNREVALILRKDLIRRDVALVRKRSDWMVLAWWKLIVWILRRRGRRRARILIVGRWLIDEILLIVGVGVCIGVLVRVLIVHMINC